MNGFEALPDNLQLPLQVASAGGALSANLTS